MFIHKKAQKIVDNYMLNVKDENKESEVAMSFNISKKEWEAIKQWQEKHIKEKHNENDYAGAIGGRYSFKWIPTSIGDVGIVKCSCGEEFTFKELY